MSGNGTYPGLRFGKKGSGGGQYIWNNVASVWNMSPWESANVYWSLDKSCRVDCQYIPPLTKTNLKKSMKNENASQKMFRVRPNS